MNISSHRAPTTNQALIVASLPIANRNEATPIPANAALFSREELRLIVLDVMG